MEAQDIRTRLLTLLTTIAPDIDPATLDPVQDMRDQVDFDSMDRLHFAMAISEEFHIDIPEQDYPLLGAVQKACEYVQAKLTSADPRRQEDEPADRLRRSAVVRDEH